MKKIILYFLFFVIICINTNAQDYSQNLNFVINNLLKDVILESKGEKELIINSKNFYYNESELIISFDRYHIIYSYMKNYSAPKNFTYKYISFYPDYIDNVLKINFSKYTKDDLVAYLGPYSPPKLTSAFDVYCYNIKYKELDMIINFFFGKTYHSLSFVTIVNDK